MQPLGLPPGYRIALHSEERGWRVDTTISLWVVDNFRGAETKVATATVSYSNDSNVSFKSRLNKVRAEAVKMFNDYVSSLQGVEVLKSIEDRLNADREMLVLTATPVAHEDR